MKIICVGRNYKAHAQELNNEVPSQPVVFMKPESSICTAFEVNLPAQVGVVHYECECVLRLAKDISLGTSIENIKSVCDAWTVGIDFTARSLQEQLKQKSLPWELAKSFENATLLGDWLPLPTSNVYEHSFTFHLNGIEKQKGNLNQLIFDFEAIINFCTQYFALQAGDVLFTGTPAGVGAVQSGDDLEGYFLDKKLLHHQIK